MVDICHLSDGLNEDSRPQYSLYETQCTPAVSLPPPELFTVLTAPCRKFTFSDMVNISHLLQAALMRQQDQNKLGTEFPRPLAHGVGANVLYSLHTAESALRSKCSNSQQMKGGF